MKWENKNHKNLLKKDVLIIKDNKGYYRFAFNELYNLFTDNEIVKFAIDGNKLYFAQSDDDDCGYHLNKTSNRNNNRRYVRIRNNKFKKFVGEYYLKYDNNKDLYYIEIENDSKETKTIETTECSKKDDNKITQDNEYDKETYIKYVFDSVDMVINDLSSRIENSINDIKIADEKYLKNIYKKLDEMCEQNLIDITVAPTLKNMFWAYKDYQYEGIGISTKFVSNSVKTLSDFMKGLTTNIFEI